MKKIFLLFLYFIMLKLNAQYLKVEYNYVKTKTQTSNSNSNYSAEFSKKIKQSEETPERQVLYYANGDSFYENFEVPDITNEKDKVTNGNTTSSSIEVFHRKKMKIFHVKNDDKVYQYFNFQDDEFYNHDKATFKSIEYKEETQTIDRLHCKLVEVKNDYGEITKIWYTEDIPISTGPLAYVNFPGLVLKIEAPSFILYATKVSNEAKEQEVEKINPKLKVYEGEAFRKKMTEVNERASKPTKREIRL